MRDGEAGGSNSWSAWRAALRVNVTFGLDRTGES
jgi:hypothetical protein